MMDVRGMILILALCRNAEAGLLEEALSTVHKTIFSDQRVINPFASLQGFKSNSVNIGNGSNDDPTSMHFKNQDFSIVLGKAGLEAIDSILDRVFNFTRKLNSQNLPFIIGNSTAAGNLDDARYATEADESSLRQTVLPQESREDNFQNFDDNFQLNRNFDVSSKSFDSLKTLKRRRPILTARDAPNYYDPSDGALKVDKNFLDLHLNENRIRTGNGLEFTSVSDEQRNLESHKTKAISMSSFNDGRLNEQNRFENTKDPSNFPASQIFANAQTTHIEPYPSLTSNTTDFNVPPTTTNNPYTHISPDPSAKKIITEARDVVTTSDDEQIRLLGLQLPGVGNFVMQRPPDPPDLPVRQQLTSTPFFSTSSGARNEGPSVGDLLGVVEPAGFPADEANSRYPVILSEPAQTTLQLITQEDQFSSKYNKNDRSIGTSPWPILGREAYQDNRQHLGKTIHDSIEDFEKNRWRHPANQPPKENREHGLFTSVVPKQNVEHQITVKNSGEIKNLLSNNLTTVSINSPNLENIVIYTNNPTVSVADQTKRPSQTEHESASINESQANADHYLSPQVLSSANPDFPLYPPLGNSSVEVTLASQLPIQESDNAIRDEAHTESETPQSIPGFESTTSDANITSNENSDLWAITGVKAENSTPSSTVTAFHTAPPVLFTAVNSLYHIKGSTSAGLPPGSHQSYSQIPVSSSIPTSESEINDFLSMVTAAGGISSLFRNFNSFLTSPSATYGSSLNHFRPAQFSSDQRDAQSQSLQNLALQSQRFDPAIRRKNLHDYLTRVFRSQQLVYDDFDQLLVNLLLQEPTHRPKKQHDVNGRLSPAQQSLLLSLIGANAGRNLQFGDRLMPSQSSALETNIQYYNAFDSASPQQRRVYLQPLQRNSDLDTAREGTSPTSGHPLLG
ncbi:uncharacterized protein LOC108675318 [Hyalella azteca]|uniref:Uncharacterized protein LOC108675318 n=1 Tax=Hyalella azteca TaxID=294128 RepID=A0A8B7NYM6_HYAAZ|nr:uncharacterized protein LOC108675318 [Hyalella azteca]